jgi:hypothetical protein
VHDRDAVRALDDRERVADLALERVRLGAADEVREGLGVGVADQVDPVGGELLAQGRRVVDDPVVDDRDVALGVGVRVGVHVVGGPVGRPAGVADAGASGEALGQVLGELAHPAGLLGDLDAAAAEHRHAGRVVPAVLEPGQPLQQQGRGLLAADVANDPAHDFSPSMIELVFGDRARRDHP